MAMFSSSVVTEPKTSAESVFLNMMALSRLTWYISTQKWLEVRLFRRRKDFDHVASALAPLEVNGDLNIDRVIRLLGNCCVSTSQLFKSFVHFVQQLIDPDNLRPVFLETGALVDSLEVQDFSKYGYLRFLSNDEGTGRDQ